jgi:hypothetical protein
MPEEWCYTTKRQTLIEERKTLSDSLAEAYKAMQGLISGEITSYNLGHYSVSRNKVDLDKLRDFITATRIRIDEIDCLLTGRSPRSVSTCVYSMPQMTRWSW